MAIAKLFTLHANAISFSAKHKSLQVNLVTKIRKLISNQCFKTVKKNSKLPNCNN